MSWVEVIWKKVPVKVIIKLELRIFSLKLQQCDGVISDILAEAEAQDYASHFARHRITWEMLKTMTDQELKEVSDEVSVCCLFVVKELQVVRVSETPYREIWIWAWVETLCCILEWDTLLSQWLSPPRSSTVRRLEVNLR